MESLSPLARAWLDRVGVDRRPERALYPDPDPALREAQHRFEERWGGLRIDAGDANIELGVGLLQARGIAPERLEGPPRLLIGTEKGGRGRRLPSARRADRRRYNLLLSSLAEVDMPDLGYDAVKRHGAALLNYAVWAWLNSPPHKDDAPEELRKGQQAWRLLPSAEAKAVDDYAERALSYVTEAVGHAIWSPAEETTTQAEIRTTLPHLDDWTFDVLWNVTYQRGMM